MSLLSSILARRWDLPPAQTRAVVREQKLRVPMDDGTVLLADRWVAEEAKDKPQPTVLVRSCYGRGGFYGLLHGRFLAERGLQVVIQSVRGTFGSEGEFNPLDERADGLTTLHWLRQQPWHEGRIGMTGESYLGFVQWAVAADADEDLTGLSIQGSASQFHGQSFPGGSMSLETSTQWMVMTTTQERGLAPLPILLALCKLPSMLSERSLRNLDRRTTGEEVAWFREVPGGWRATSRRGSGASGPTCRWSPAGTTPSRRGSWRTTRRWWRPAGTLSSSSARGRTSRKGSSPPASARAWLRGHLHDDWSFANRAPVRVYVTGERAGGGWRELERWPPEESAARRLWLTNGARLTWDSPGSDQAGSKRYRYDPADPTPSVGGPIMITAKTVRDNRKLESRPDVITFTTEPLDGPLEAIGPARVELFARATEPYFDLFARVCDVDPDGASWNVCDALASVAPGRFEHSEEEGVWRVEFDLWPLAHRFAAGHRIRLQVSSGAHPRYVRNPGTGEHPLEAETLLPVDVEILHGPDHGSSVELPILPR